MAILWHARRQGASLHTGMQLCTQALTVLSAAFVQRYLSEMLAEPSEIQAASIGQAA